jgi:DNA adenine methylase
VDLQHRWESVVVPPTIFLEAAEESMTKPSRPALRYYGGKWRIAPWIVSHFPPHLNYLELCGGAGSVLLHKPRSKLETFNDIDQQVNFFQALRDQTDELMRVLKLTPWSRTEYYQSHQLTDDPVENARRFFVLSWQSLHGATQWSRSGWRVQKHADGRSTCAPRDGWDIDHLYQVAERFRGVQIEHMDALELFQRGYDSPETLTYFDPPYVSAVRSRTDRYKYEVGDDYHAQAAEVLREAKGYVIVSGMASPLYAELYEAHGWKRVETDSRGNSASMRIEALWLNPRTVQALENSIMELPLFSTL